MAVEIPFVWQILFDVVIGAIIGSVVFEQIQKAMVAAGVAGFFFTIIFVGIGNPESLTNITVADASERITFIVTTTVYFMLHLLFVEIGAIPSNLIAQFIRDR
jgi:ABC-type transport system involved in cytochrome c biogenesis permease subunit